MERVRRDRRLLPDRLELPLELDDRRLQAADPAHLAQFAELLWLTRIGVPIFARQARDREHILVWADEHEAITEAVSAGQGVRAERLTRDHIAAYPPPPEP